MSGKRADLIILEGNLLQMHKHRVGSIDVALAMMDVRGRHAHGEFTEALAEEQYRLSCSP